MAEPSIGPVMTDTDLDLVVGAAAPEASERERLKALVQQDRDFRKAMLSDDGVFRRLMSDDEAFVKVSPGVYFEVLLRRAFKDLELSTHTVERSGRETIPVFDTGQVVAFLGRPGVVEYLAHMLASFTRIQGYVVPVRVRRGIRRRVRFNDMDVDSLIRLCSTADEPQRFNYYKRIADVCLFITGVFRDHAFSGADAPVHAARRHRRSVEEYEAEGKRFYGLAEAHPTAGTMRLSEVFGLLREHFAAARKPLSFISGQYLHAQRHRLFGGTTE